MRARVKAGNEVCGRLAGRHRSLLRAARWHRDPPPIRWHRFDALCRVTALFSEDHGVHARSSKPLQRSSPQRSQGVPDPHASAGRMSPRRAHGHAISPPGWRGSRARHNSSRGLARWSEVPSLVADPARSQPLTSVCGRSLPVESSSCQRPSLSSKEMPVESPGTTCS
jgi:hypothetical protein